MLSRCECSHLCFLAGHVCLPKHLNLSSLSVRYILDFVSRSCIQHPATVSMSACLSGVVCMAAYVLLICQLPHSDAFFCIAVFALFHLFSYAHPYRSEER